MTPLLSWIVLVAWIATLIRTILNVLLIPRLRPGAAADGPLVSVIIPARNEQAAIERTVRGLLAQTYRNLEVLVVDDRSTDATPAILAGIEDHRLTVIRGEEPPPGWLGKPWALHQGSLRASGDILLFVDADIRYQPEAVAGAVEMLRTSGVAMIALLPWFETRGFWENVAMPQLTVTALGFLPTWLSNRTRVVLLAIGGGAGNMIHRPQYEAMGGHSALKDSVVDDVALARCVRRAGSRTMAIRAVDLVAVRMYRGGREIIEGFTKNLFAVVGRSYFWTIVGAILAVVFHVYPYVMALLGEWISIVTVVIISITRLIIFRAARHPLVYALFAHPLMVLFWTWISLRSMWLTGVRRQLIWRARTYDAGQTRFGGDR